MPVLLHGPVAAELLRREGLEDEEVYQGIYYHSTGCPGMSPVAKVVFLADKLDPHKLRRYPYLEELSVTALGSLDAAVLMFFGPGDWQVCGGRAAYSPSFGGGAERAVGAGGGLAVEAQELSSGQVGVAYKLSEQAPA